MEDIAKAMGDIARAIEKLSEKDIIDYLIVIVPVVISIVAIVISIATARKQNKIALFEKKYNSLIQIHTIASFANSIKDNNNLSSKLILVFFDAYWGTDISNISGTEIQKAIRAKSQISLIKTQVSQAQFLFKRELSVDLNVMGELFHKVVMDAIGNDTSNETINEFCELCDAFYKNDFPKMKKRLYF